MAGTIKPTTADEQETEVDGLVGRKMMRCTQLANQELGLDSPQQLLHISTNTFCHVDKARYGGALRSFSPVPTLR
jgi:hypothetical protein